MKSARIVMVTLVLLLTISIGFALSAKEEINTGQIDLSNHSWYCIGWSPVVGLILISIGGFGLWQSNKK